ncbi:MAG TPA: hypothetical protein VGD69_27635 [Herpetosiphonaceae bacterium]
MQQRLSRTLQSVVVVLIGLTCALALIPAQPARANEWPGPGWSHAGPVSGGCHESGHCDSDTGAIISGLFEYVPDREYKANGDISGTNGATHGGYPTYEQREKCWVQGRDGRVTLDWAAGTWHHGATWQRVNGRWYDSNHHWVFYHDSVCQATPPPTLVPPTPTAIPTATPGEVRVTVYACGGGGLAPLTVTIWNDRTGTRRQASGQGSASLTVPGESTSGFSVARVGDWTVSETSGTLRTGESKILSAYSPSVCNVQTPTPGGPTPGPTPPPCTGSIDAATPILDGTVGSTDPRNPTVVDTIPLVIQYASRNPSQDGRRGYINDSQLIMEQSDQPWQDGHAGGSNVTPWIEIFGHDGDVNAGERPMWVDTKFYQPARFTRSSLHWFSIQNGRLYPEGAANPQTSIYTTVQRNADGLIRFAAAYQLKPEYAPYQDAYRSNPNLWSIQRNGNGVALGLGYRGDYEIAPGTSGFAGSLVTGKSLIPNKYYRVRMQNQRLSCGHSSNSPWVYRYFTTVQPVQVSLIVANMSGQTTGALGNRSIKLESWGSAGVSQTTYRTSAPDGTMEIPWTPDIVKPGERLAIEPGVPEKYFVWKIDATACAGATTDVQTGRVVGVASGCAIRFYYIPIPEFTATARARARFNTPINGVPIQLLDQQGAVLSTEVTQAQANGGSEARLTVTAAQARPRVGSAFWTLKAPPTATAAAGQPLPLSKAHAPTNPGTNGSVNGDTSVRIAPISFAFGTIFDYERPMVVKLQLESRSGTPLGPIAGQTILFRGARTPTLPVPSRVTDATGTVTVLWSEQFQTSDSLGITRATPPVALPEQAPYGYAEHRQESPDCPGTTIGNGTADVRYVDTACTVIITYRPTVRIDVRAVDRTGRPLANVPIAIRDASNGVIVPECGTPQAGGGRTGSYDYTPKLTGSDGYVSCSIADGAAVWGTVQRLSIAGPATFETSTVFAYQPGTNMRVVNPGAPASAQSFALDPITVSFGNVIVYDAPNTPQALRIDGSVVHGPVAVAGARVQLREEMQLASRLWVETKRSPLTVTTGADGKWTFDVPMDLHRQEARRYTVELIAWPAGLHPHKATAGTGGMRMVSQTRLQLEVPPTVTTDIVSINNQFALGQPDLPSPCTVKCAPPPAAETEMKLRIHSRYDGRKAVYESSGNAITWPQGEVLDWMPKINLDVPASSDPAFTNHGRIVAWSYVSSTVNGDEVMSSGATGAILRQNGCASDRYQPRREDTAGTDTSGLTGCIFGYRDDVTGADMAGQAHSVWSVLDFIDMDRNVYVYRMTDLAPVTIKLQIKVYTWAADNATGHTVPGSEATEIVTESFTVNLVTPRSAT